MKKKYQEAEILITYLEKNCILLQSYSGEGDYEGSEWESD